MKKLVLVLFLGFAFIGCSNDDSPRAGISGQRGNDGAVVSTQPVEASYAFAAKLNGVSDRDFDRLVRQYLSFEAFSNKTPAEIDEILYGGDLAFFGNMENSLATNKGIKIELRFIEGSLRDLNNTVNGGVELRLTLNDSNVTENGWDPIVDFYNKGQINFIGNYVEIIFLNAFLQTEVKIKGNVSGSKFIGELVFDNKQNPFSGKLLDIDFSI